MLPPLLLGADHPRRGVCNLPRYSELGFSSPNFHITNVRGGPRQRLHQPKLRLVCQNSDLRRLEDHASARQIAPRYATGGRKQSAGRFGTWSPDRYKRSDLVCDCDDEISPGKLGISFWLIALSTLARDKASLLQWIRYRFMLYANPVSCGEFFDRPLAVVPPRLLFFSPPRAIRQIIDRRIIDHAGLQTARGGRRTRDRALPPAADRP
jgi:hypothetical protein